MEDFIVPLITIALVEFGDKSQLAILGLSSRTKNYLVLLAGVMLAFSIVDGTAILLGNLATNLIPNQSMKLISGGLFIFFGLAALVKKRGVEKEINSPEGVFLSGFLLVFLSEWGDKTQLSSALFAAKYNPVLVFAGIILSLFLLSAAAIFAGSFLYSKISHRTVNILSAVIFIILGSYSIFS